MLKKIVLIPTMYVKNFYFPFIKATGDVKHEMLNVAGFIYRYLLLQ
jgi:hypothetical protein